MDKKLQKDIADYIQAETKGGYLQDWGEVAPLMTPEQQRDYFLILAGHILSKVKKAGYHKVKGEPPVLNDEETRKIQDYIDRNDIYKVEFGHYEPPLLMKWIPLKTYRICIKDILQEVLK